MIKTKSMCEVVSTKKYPNKWSRSIPSISVVPCYNWQSHESPIRDAIYDFFLIANDAAQLLSWYLHRASGVPANHSEPTIVARDDPGEVENLPRPSSSLEWSFESIDALADWSILYLPDTLRENAAIAWIHESFRQQLDQWGLPADRLNEAVRAAVKSDPAMVKPPTRQRIESLGDDPSMREEQFWDLVALLEGVADDAGTTRLVNALSRYSRDQIDGFERLLQRAIAILDTDEHANPDVAISVDPLLESEVPFSDDTFLYVRCDIVASGRDTWVYVANNPEAIAKPWNIRSEGLLMVVPS